MRLKLLLLILSSGVAVWSCKTSDKTELASELGADSSAKEAQDRAVRAATDVLERDATRNVVDLALLASKYPVTSNINGESHQRYGNLYATFEKASIAGSGAVGGASSVLTWQNRELIAQELRPLIEYFVRVGREMKAAGAWSSQQSQQSAQRVSAIPAKIANVVQPIVQASSNKSYNSIVNTPVVIARVLNESANASRAISQELGESLLKSAQSSGEGIVSSAQAVTDVYLESVRQSINVSQRITAEVVPYAQASIRAYRDVMAYLTQQLQQSSQNAVMSSQQILAAVQTQLYRALNKSLGELVYSSLVSNIIANTSVELVTIAVNTTILALSDASITSANFVVTAQEAVTKALVNTGRFSSAQARAFSTAIGAFLGRLQESVLSASKQISIVVADSIMTTREISVAASTQILNVIYQSILVAKDVSISVARIVEPLVQSSLGITSRIVQSSLTVSLEPFKSSADIIRMFVEGIYTTVYRIYVPVAAAAKYSSNQSMTALASSMRALGTMYEASLAQALNLYLRSMLSSAYFNDWVTMQAAWSSQQSAQVKEAILAATLRVYTSSKNASTQSVNLVTALSAEFSRLGIASSQTSQRMAREVAVFVGTQVASLSENLSAVWNQFIGALVSSGEFSQDAITATWRASVESVRSAKQASVGTSQKVSAAVVEFYRGAVNFSFEGSAASARLGYGMYVLGVTAAKAMSANVSVMFTNIYTTLLAGSHAVSAWSGNVSAAAWTSLTQAFWSVVNPVAQSSAYSVNFVQNSLRPISHFSHVSSTAFMDLVAKPYGTWIAANKSGSVGIAAISASVSAAMGYSIYQSTSVGNQNYSQSMVSQVLGSNADLQQQLDQATGVLANIYSLNPNARAEVKDRYRNIAVREGIRTRFNPEKMNLDVAGVIEPTVSKEEFLATDIIAASIAALGYRPSEDDLSNPFILASKVHGYLSSALLIESVCSSPQVAQAEQRICQNIQGRVENTMQQVNGKFAANY